MEPAVQLAIFVSWTIQALIIMLVWLYWLQVKEYRFDRFILLFKSREKRKLLKVALLGIKLLLISVFSLMDSGEMWMVVMYSLVSATLFIASVKKGFVRPVLTKRAQKIIATSIVPSMLLLIVFNTISRPDLGLFLADTYLIVGIFVGIAWTKLIVNKVKKDELVLLGNKIKKVNPVVVGVTGSYGKTTTKEFISTILSEKYKVAKTVGSRNTEFGVIRSVLSGLKEDTEYFVAEYGAYKKGEIKKLTEILPPNIAVITGIEPQHLELFGSLENIIDAKFELVEALPKGGVAIFNMNNKYCREMYSRARKQRKDLKVLGYGVGENADIVTKVLSVDIGKIIFESNYKGKKQNLVASIHGTHFVQNITASILVGFICELSGQEIKKSVARVEQPDKTMNVKKLKSGAIVIDDSFNSSLSGFLSALEYMMLYKNKKKIVFTSGIIELGKESGRVHLEIGKKMKDNIDLLVLRDSSNLHDLSTVETKVAKNPYDMAEIFMENNNKANVILLEGKLPSELISKIK